MFLMRVALTLEAVVFSSRMLVIRSVFSRASVYLNLFSAAFQLITFQMALKYCTIIVSTLIPISLT